MSGHHVMPPSIPVRSSTPSPGRRDRWSDTYSTMKLGTMRTIAIPNATSTAAIVPRAREDPRHPCRPRRRRPRPVLAQGPLVRVEGPARPRSRDPPWQLGGKDHGRPRGAVRRCGYPDALRDLGWASPSATSRFRPRDFDNPSARRLPPPHRGSFLLRLPGTSERCSIGCPAVDPRVPSSGVVEDESELSAPDVDVEDQRPLLTPDPLRPTSRTGRPGSRWRRRRAPSPPPPRHRSDSPLSTPA
jgi:hypothetical protein